MADVRLPYFDSLLQALANGDKSAETSFGRHVHWGYWPKPEESTLTPEDYGRAAERLSLELLGHADIADGARVLDAGCGFGGTIATLNETRRGLDMTGLNIDPRQIARAREIVRPLDDNRIGFVEGDACALPFADASFDRLLAVECIFHFPSRRRYFEEARRVLKPGGTLTLSDFVPSTLFSPLCRVGALPGLRRIGPFGDCRFDYTVARYRALAASTGFDLVVDRDVTAHTIPTYHYLTAQAARNSANGRAPVPVKFLMGVGVFLARRRLLTYRLLSFRKR